MKLSKVCLTHWGLIFWFTISFFDKSEGIIFKKLFNFSEAMKKSKKKSVFFISTVNIYKYITRSEFPRIAWFSTNQTLELQYSHFWLAKLYDFLQFYSWMQIFTFWKFQFKLFLNICELRRKFQTSVNWIFFFVNKVELRSFTSELRFWL